MIERGEFDYVIVGGGSAGCVLAARLTRGPGRPRLPARSRPGRQERRSIHCPAGLALLAKNGACNWGFETVPQPGLNGRRGYQPRGKVLGGSSSVNAMIYVRGQPRATTTAGRAEGNAGWALGRRAAVLQARRAQRARRRRVPRQRRPAQRDGPAQPEPLRAGLRRGRRGRPAIRVNADFNGADQEGVGLYQVTHKNGERFSAAKAYLDAEPRPRRTCTVITGAHDHAHPLRRQARDRRRVPRSGGRRSSRGARREVLLCGRRAAVAAAADALGHRARRSTCSALGIAVAHDLPGVGRNLHDHVDVVAGASTRRS